MYRPGEQPGTASVPGPGKRVCITGGAGFLGSHLCERLLAQGNAVTCLDNFQTGTLANVAHLRADARFTVVEHDITQPFPAFLPAFDQIYNLACAASPPQYQADPVKTALTCAIGTLNVLERAHRDGARVLHASTSEIYGDPEVHPQPETYVGHVNPIGPRSCYDEGKRFAETLCTDFAGRHRVAVRIARIFNTYGPRMRPDDGRVVSNFVTQALSGRDITIYGNGSQTRSFCYVDDLIDGLVRLMNAPGTLPGPVNIGNPAEITVGELAEIVLEMTGSPSRINSLPLPIDDPTRRRPDITRAASLLGWSPRTPLRAGLARTIAYFAAREALPPQEAAYAAAQPLSPTAMENA